MGDTEVYHDLQWKKGALEAVKLYIALLKAEIKRLAENGQDTREKFKELQVELEKKSVLEFEITLEETNQVYIKGDSDNEK